MYLKDNQSTALQVYGPEPLDGFFGSIANVVKKTVTVPTKYAAKATKFIAKPIIKGIRYATCKPARSKIGMSASTAAVASKNPYGMAIGTGAKIVEGLCGAGKRPAATTTSGSMAAMPAYVPQELRSYVLPALAVGGGILLFAILKKGKKK